MNVGPEAVLAGFYVYGAICYALIGAASIAWHNRLAFALVLIGAVATAISYLIQVEVSTESERTFAKVAITLGWILPCFAAGLLVFWI